MSEARDGIINLYKAPGITSAKALYRVRSITGVRKSGHGGTLDPAAAGVLLICQGRATKLVERIMDLPKVYRATARLDVTSESHDADRPLMDVAVSQPPPVDAVADALASFEGEIEQVPPRISAVKVGGVPAYKLAGDARAAELKPRKVRVHWTHVHRYHWPELEFEVACGRGTYIRSIVRDLGQRLGVGGCLTSLTRGAVGPFIADEAWTIERLRDTNDAGLYLIVHDAARSMIAGAAGSVPCRPEV